MFSDSGAKLPALPAARYPRVFQPRSKTLGYYFVLGVVSAVWSVTPISFAYLGWYAWRGRSIGGLAGVGLGAVAVYAAVESAFAVWYWRLGRSVQTPAPPTSISHDELSNLFLRVLHAGLSYPAAGPAGRKRAVSNAALTSAVARAMDAADDLDLPEGTNTGAAAEAHEEAHANATNGLLGVPDPVNLRKRGRLASGKVPTEAEFLDPEEEGDELFDENGMAKDLERDDPRSVEFREQLRTWFDGAAWDDIKRDDVKSWLAWSCFGLPLADVQADPKRQRFLERTTAVLEARTGAKFPEGLTGMRIMRLTLDPVNVVQRPFIVYAISNSINWFLREKLYPHRGMKLCREGGIDYFLRIPAGWTPEKGMKERNCIPVVYLHGLGFGLLQNHLLIRHLVHSLPTHPLLIPLAYHTTQEIFQPRYLKPWTRPELVGFLKAACEKHGFWRPGDDGRKAAGGVSMMSHSNGSVYHAWVIKDAPELVRRSAFVDPVVFGLWEGHVCHSFCYRPPSTALELAMYYFVASEVGIANYIQRHFNWCDNVLFLEDIPNCLDSTRTAFFLGGKDIIVDAPRVRLSLERHGVTKGLHWDADAGHGDGLLGESRDRVVMYVGTGSTRGWEGWLTRGRRSHSLGQYDRPLTPVGSGTATPTHPRAPLASAPLPGVPRRRRWHEDMMGRLS